VEREGIVPGADQDSLAFGSPNLDNVAYTDPDPVGTRKTRIVILIDLDGSRESKSICAIHYNLLIVISRWSGGASATPSIDETLGVLGTDPHTLPARAPDLDDIALGLVRQVGSDPVSGFGCESSSDRK